MDLCQIPQLAPFCQVADHATAGVVVASLQFLTDQVSGAAAAVLQGMWSLFETTTFVDLTTGQFTRVYNLVFGIAVFLMVGFFLIQVVTGMLRREPAALTRAVLGLAKSVLGSFVAVSLLATALDITDRLCLGIVAAAGTNLSEVGDRITLLTAGTALTASAGVGGAMIVSLLLATMVVAAALILWFSLLIRKALLLVAIVFAPVALAGASWDVTRGWIGRWASFVIALVVSKVVIVVFLLLATAQLTAPISTDLASLSDPVSGVVLLLVAGFAPYLTYKAISFIGFDIHQAVSAEQEAKQSINRTVPVPTRWMHRGEAPRVLDDPGGGGTTAQPPARSKVTVPAGPGTASSPAAGSASAPASGGAGAASSGAGAGAGAAALGPLAAGAVAVKETAAAGPRLGRGVAEQAARHTGSVPSGSSREEGDR